MVDASEDNVAVRCLAFCLLNLDHQTVGIFVGPGRGFHNSVLVLSPMLQNCPFFMILNTNVLYFLQLLDDFVDVTKDEKQIDLRQGDPLFPSFFAIVGEALNRMVTVAGKANLVNRFKLVINAPMITHLQLADDTLILCVE